ncbi:MAG: ribonucleoside-diphosphate reductase subunit alpha, partial [Burkholderiales bacterium]|nr:ribonucleoside-diphosphate reductase subunit alpha [Burkholderiales bacterium]
MTDSVNTAQNHSSYADYKTIRRDGSVVPFAPNKITVAVTKTFIAVLGSDAASSAAVRQKAILLTESVVSALMRRKPEGGAIHIEDIQDQVELALMRAGEHDVARAYVLYREERSKERHSRFEPEHHHEINVLYPNGSSRPLDLAQLKALIASCCKGLEGTTDQAAMLAVTLKNVYDGVPAEEVRRALIMSS